MVLKVLVAGMSRLEITKNNRWELDSHVLGLDTREVNKIFNSSKFKFEISNGQNSNLKICNGQKFEICNGHILY